MKQTLLIWVAFLCFATNFISAQDAAVNKIIEIGQTDNQVMNHLDVLTNRIGGRVIGSNAYDNAVEWVAHQFKEWGLEVEIQEAGTLPVGFNRGPWFGKLIGENSMDLHFVTPSYTAGTKGVQRGHVLLEPRTQEEFNQIKGQLKGAWVLVNGESSGWTIDRSSRSDSIRKTIIAENEKIRSKNWAIIKENRKNRTIDCLSLDDFIKTANEKEGFIRAMWCGDPECEKKLKDEAGVSSRCMPFDGEPIGDTCVCCGKKAKHMLYWGKAY